MIPVKCGQCQHEFEVPDIRAGVHVLCPPCGNRVKVPREGEEEAMPELVGAHVTEDAYRAGAERAPRGAPTGAPGRTRSWSPGDVSHVQEWHEPESSSRDDGTRIFEPHVEDELRRRNLFRIGLALTIAFMAPIVGVPGHALVFPQFSAFPGANLAGLLMLLPLFAGVTLMVMSKQADLPRRGVVTLAAGVAMFGLLLVDQGARSAVGESLSAVPTSASLSTVLLILGSFGLFLSVRVRYYRPLDSRAHMIGLVAAACYLLYMFVPTNGSSPIWGAMQMFRLHKGVALGMLGHYGLMVAAAVLCVTNSPAKNWGAEASDRARRAFLCMVGALVVPVIMLTLAAMSVSNSMSGSGMGSPATMFFSAALKFGVMFGGLALLIPVGIADLLVGRPDED